MEEKRIPELDLLRGLAVIGMLVVHFIFDLEYFGGWKLSLPFWLRIPQKYGHLIFILLSGICATLGHRSFQRGMVVFSCGLLVSYVTLYMDLILGYSDLRIWFGILHLLGFSMMVYPLFRDFLSWELGFLGTFMILAGMIFEQAAVRIPWLFPFGLCPETLFPGSDYFPVFPNFGWFLLGAAAGKLLYREKRSLLPWISRENFLTSLFMAAGRNSLLIYLLHQPVLIMITFFIINQGAA